VSDGWPALILVATAGLIIWVLWPFITGRDVAPWDEDEGEDEK
jgi:hypothetical protein